MKIEAIVNVLLAIVCVVVIAVGVLELKSRLRGPRSGVPAVETMQGLSLTLGPAAIVRKPAAALVLIEFSDYQCPFCGRYARETFAQVQRELVDVGKISYAFMNLPLQRAHPLAFKAAEAAECAGDQGRYWEMHKVLFANQPALTQPDLLSYAQAIGLDRVRFNACLNGQMVPRIDAQISEAHRLGIMSTPTFLIGETEPGGEVHLLRKIVGAQSLPLFTTTLDSLLRPPMSPLQ